MPFKNVHGARWGGGWFRQEWDKPWRHEGPLVVAGDGHESYLVPASKPKDWVSRVTPIRIVISPDGGIQHSYMDSTGKYVKTMKPNGEVEIEGGDGHYDWS